MKFFKNKMQTGATLGALALVGCLAAGPMYAYLTDNEQTTNTFTVGKVQIDLEEPNYPGNDSDKVKNIVPNQVIEKNPQVENTGKNDAIVFATVSIPVKKLNTALADGTKNGEQMTQVFQTSTDGANFTDVAHNDNWVLLGDAKYYDANGVEAKGTADASGIPTDAVKVVRTYGYNTKLAPSTATAVSTTNPIFTHVKLANVIEGYIDSTTQDIEVKTFAIQADNITGATADTTDGLDKAELNSIYAVYVKQNSETASKDANTSNKKNLKGDTQLSTYNERVTISIDNSTLAVGDTTKVRSTVDAQAADATATYSVDGNKTDVVEVDADGTVKANGVGTATIVASYGEASAKVTVTVKAGKTAAQVTANKTTH